MAWSLWRPTPIQEPSRVPPRVSSFDPKMLRGLLCLRKFRSPVPGVETNTDGLWLTMVQLKILNFMMLWEQSTSSRNCTLNFDFWPFPRLMICDMILSCDARQRQPPVSHAIMRKNSWCNHSVPRQPFCFSFPVQYSINYMRYSTFYYKIGLVLDDFAQL